MFLRRRQNKFFIIALICLMMLKKIRTIEDQLTEMEGASGTFAFWHIFTSGKYFKTIVDEQKYIMEASGLVEKLDRVFFTTNGPNYKELSLEGEKFQHLVHFGNKAQEHRTLHQLYLFCHKNTKAKVLYFHNKGSYNYNAMNIKFRRALDCFVLTPNCIEALKTHDICGWRLSPLPHIHYSGNFWWATCEHINELIPPTTMRRNQTFLNIYQSLFKPDVDIASQKPYLGIHRFFGETWLGSRPVFKPADCMSSKIDSSYIVAYNVPETAMSPYCPNFNFSTNSSEPFNSEILPEKLKIGSTCTTAAVMNNPDDFADAIRILPPMFSNFTKELVKRSYMWYGKAPITYIEILNRLKLGHLFL